MPLSCSLNISLQLAGALLGWKNLVYLDAKLQKVKFNLSRPFFSILLSLPLFTGPRQPVQPSADLKEASGKPHPGLQPQASECICPC